MCVRLKQECRGLNVIVVLDAHQTKRAQTVNVLEGLCPFRCMLFGRVIVSAVVPNHSHCSAINNADT